MAIFQTVDESSFIDAFLRSQYSKNFSYDSLRKLYEYYSNLDEEIELDIVAISYEWLEYSFQNFCIEFDFENIDDDFNSSETVYFLDRSNLLYILVDADTILVSFC